MAPELYPDYQFYTVDFEGENGKTELQEIDGAYVNSPREKAVEAVNTRFAQLISQKPNIGPLFVIRRSLGVVAAEYIHAWPAHVRERQGQPDRQLKWVVDPISTGLG